MAKKKTNVDNLLSAIRKRTDSSSFADSDLLKISEYISTGSYAINRIVSGDIHKGIPAGRIITLAGESACTPRDQMVTIMLEDDGDWSAVKDVEIGSLETMTKPYSINTPDGWQKTGKFVNKGVLSCKELIAFGDVDTYKINASDDHLIETVRGWVTMKELSRLDKVLVEDGTYADVMEINDIGEIECVDIEVLHDNHRYYCQGISSHNTGKSLLAATIIRNALVENDYDVIFYIDSEGGGLDSFLEKEGADLNKIEHILVNSVEMCSSKLLYIYDQVEQSRKASIAADEKPIKAMVVLDSFGALVADKFVNDAVDKDKQVSDMGSTARLKNAMMKSLMTRVMSTQCSLIVLNHVYDNPAAMFTSKVKEMPGGKGIQFASHIILQTSKKLEKDANVKETSYYKGNTLKFFTVKNRIIKPGYTAECYIDFDNGINKWEGLVEEARRLGFIEGGTAGLYLVPSFSDKKIRMNRLLAEDEIWETFLEEFNEKSFKEIQYGSKTNVDDQIDDIVNGEDEGIII